MPLAIVTAAVGALLGFGAVQELWIRGVVGGEAQPLVVGVLGAAGALLLLAAAAALARRSPRRRGLALLAASANLVLPAYGALPPHRNVGLLALALGAGCSLLLLAAFLRPSAGGPPRAAPA